MALRSVPLERSKMKHPRGAKLRDSYLDLHETIQATVVVRPRMDAVSAVDSIARQLPAERPELDFDEIEQTYGSAPEDLERVVEFARENSLEVLDSSAARGCVVLSGSADDLRKIFGVKFCHVAVRGRTYRSYEGAIGIPKELEGIVEAVFGLDNRPVGVHHTIAHRVKVGEHTEAHNVAKYYDFPHVVRGKRQCIAVIEDGGGFHKKDIHAYWKKRNIRAPQVEVVEIHGAKNDPAPAADIRKYWKELQRRLKTGAPLMQPPLTGDPDLDEQVRETIEATMNVELVGAFAPLHRIVVYFNDGTSQGVYHAFTRALTDRTNKPSVISYSWGETEADSGAALVHVMEHVFRRAALHGVTVCCSSGDEGDGVAAYGRLSVNYPASSPYVLGCGGTHLFLSKKKEEVWNELLGGIQFASSGGVSDLFPTPNWQTAAGIEQITGRSGRGVPDVAAKADLILGYSMYVGGIEIGMGGTSASAPLWASLVAALNRKLGVRVGYLTPILYATGLPQVTNDTTSGNNGTFYAGAGWDACTGWGSPRGRALLRALEGRATRATTAS